MKRSTFIISGFLYASAAVAILHILGSESFLSSHVSDYALGPYHWLLLSAFLVTALSSIFLAKEIRNHKSVEMRAGAIFLDAWSALIFLAGLVNTDASGPRTIHGLLHNHSANLAFFFVTLSILLISIAINHMRLIVLSFITAFSYIGLYEFARGTAVVGLMQRIFLISVILSLISITLSLRKPAK